VNDESSEQVAGESVGSFLDEAVDLTARFLTDRTDLSVSALFAINRVRREGPLRLTTLAAKEGISQPSMTQLITRLEKQGFLSRTADPEDGRGTLVGITELGHDALADRRRLRRERLGELLDTLTPEERHALLLSAHVALPILRKLAANADCPDDDDQRKVLE
jgi:DNA-binding MarR family transcriptional regulator